MEIINNVYVIYYIVIGLLAIIIATLIYKMIKSSRDTKRLLKENTEALKDIKQLNRDYKDTANHILFHSKIENKKENVIRLDADIAFYTKELNAVKKELNKFIGNNQPGQKFCPCCEMRNKPPKRCHKCKMFPDECKCIDTNENAPVRAQ